MLSDEFSSQQWASRNLGKESPVADQDQANMRQPWHGACPKLVEPERAPSAASLPAAVPARARARSQTRVRSDHSGLCPQPRAHALLGLASDSRIYIRAYIPYTIARLRAVRYGYGYGSARGAPDFRLGTIGLHHMSSDANIVVSGVI